MKTRTKFLLVTSFLVMIFVIGGVALADDGAMHRRNVSGTPDQLTGDAAIASMPFYVPAQAASGEVLTSPIEYYDKEGTLVDTREFARPLISVYIDDLPVAHEPTIMSADMIETGTGFAARDAYAAVSLDDGSTWKKTNLSRSADLSSFTLRNGHPYPGDAFRLEFAVVENKILAVWLSRYCSSGNPAYAMVDELTGEPIYDDFFGVSGAQGSVDYTLQGFPEIGEIPYGCVWAARGTLEEVESDTEGTSFEVVWRKPERLTSGRRDANVQAVAGAKGAGFVLVWQEDPEGLRPGQGLGPGEGWSGAIVNQKTDMWYSYIGWDDFDEILIDETEPVEDTLPKTAIPFTVPIRITDNEMCKTTPTLDDEGEIINQYCYEDFNLNGTSDFCADAVSWTNPGGTTLSLCKTEGGQVLWGRTGASRTRMSLIPYTKADETVSAWVVMAYEETKALGSGGGTDEEPVDIGKDVMYHSFDMFEPDMVSTGFQLNQPAFDPITGEVYPPILDEVANAEFYDSEIARRFSLIIQNPTSVGDSDTTMVAIYKQGIVNQGGPADIMIRRFTLPENWDGVTNPFSPENMVCEDWIYDPDSDYNPYYPYGLCMENAINVSSPSITACDMASSPESCVEDFPWEGGDKYNKVTHWDQMAENLDDQSWENPYDVAKGHRGFIDGDFVMMMYAWSSNWKANSIGNDKYNLYVRRSFDGGVTWTTTPADLGGTGTCHIENYLDEEGVENCYSAGEYEQARNVSQLIGSRITVLDPRYTPTTATITEPLDLPDGWPFYYPNYDDDARNHEHFFVVYETGDNTTLPEFAAVPMDLFYSRAYMWGDYYDEIDTYIAKTDTTEKRWDWLENQQDDLSGEASVTTNPGGTFFYSVWNQWQELQTDVITNSDMIFRRVMYLDEVTSPPSAEILYMNTSVIGHNEDRNLVILTGARDNDHVGEGIVSYEWVSDLDGVLTTEKDINLLSTALSPGYHTLKFTVMDGEGDTAIVITKVLVLDYVMRTYLPAFND